MIDDEPGLDTNCWWYVQGPPLYSTRMNLAMMSPMIAIRIGKPGCDKTFIGRLNGNASVVSLVATGISLGTTSFFSDVAPPLLLLLLLSVDGFEGVCLGAGVVAVSLLLVGVDLALLLEEDAAAAGGLLDPLPGSLDSP